MKFNFEKKVLATVAALGIGNAAAQDNINKQADQAFANGHATKQEQTVTGKKIDRNDPIVKAAYEKATQVNSKPSAESGYMPGGILNGKEYFIKIKDGTKSAGNASSSHGGHTTHHKKAVFAHRSHPIVRSEHHTATPPEVDVIYIEPKSETVPQIKEFNPFEGYAPMDELVYGTNNHPLYEVFYLAKKTQDIKDGGVLNTQNQPVRLFLYDQRAGHDGQFTGDYVDLSSDEKRKILKLDDGSRHVTNPETQNEIIEMAKKYTALQKNKRETPSLDQDFVKQSDTVNFPGANMDIAQGDK